MKKLILTVISSVMITSCFANGLNLSMAEVKFQHKDGRVLGLQKDIEAVHLNADQVDYIELGSGEIVDQSDLWPVATFNTSDNSLVNYIKGFQSPSDDYSIGLQSLYIKNSKIDYVEFDNGVITDRRQVIDMLNGHLVDGSFGIDGGG